MSKTLPLLWFLFSHAGGPRHRGFLSKHNVIYFIKSFAFAGSDIQQESTSIKWGYSDEQTDMEPALRELAF